MDNEERRQHKRLCPENTLAVRELTFPVGTKPAVKVEMTDVSEGGLGFLSATPYAAGTSLELTITLPGWFRHTHAVSRYREDDKPLVAVARVARCEPAAGGKSYIGVQFTDIWQDHWRAMRGHLQEMLDKPA
jgi:hypothetical protein